MNPLMQAMNNPAPSRMTNISQLMNIARMLRSGNPQQIAQNLRQQNPQFKAFMDANQGKTPEQVAKEHGIDFNQIMGMMK